MERPNLVILMAGGLGSRLGALTDTIPKPLIPVRGKPALEHIVEGFLAAGFRRFVISVGYRGGQIREHFGGGERWGARVDYVWDTVRMGTAGALGLIDRPDASAFVMNGDVLADVDYHALLRFHQNSGAFATVVTRELVTTSPYGVLEIAGNHVAGIEEKPVRRDAVAAGIYVLRPEAWLKIPMGPFDMPALLSALIQWPPGVAAFPIWGEWVDIGTPEDLARAHE
jgi:NDP-sugar pyrophosphorylase family protein